MFGPLVETDPVGQRESAETVLRRLAELDVGELSEADLAGHLPGLYRLKNLIDAAVVDAVGVFDGRKQHTLGGAWTTAGWLAARVDVSRAHASTMVKVARQARHMDLSMDAARAGDLGFDKLQALAAARGVSETTAKEFDADEARLLDAVARRNVERGARALRNWVAAADPDADDVAHQDRDAKRKVNLSTSMEGMGFLDGLLTSEANAVIGSELEAIIEDLHRNGLSVDAQGNRLTAAQMRHDAFIEMAQRAGASSTIVEIRRGAKRRARETAAARDGDTVDDAATTDDFGGEDMTDGATDLNGEAAADRGTGCDDAGPAASAATTGAAAGDPDTTRDTPDDRTASATTVSSEGAAGVDARADCIDDTAVAPGRTEPSDHRVGTVAEGSTTQSGATPAEDTTGPSAPSTSDEFGGAAEDGAEALRPDGLFGPELFGPDDLDDVEPLDPLDGDQGCGCSQTSAARGLLLPPGHAPPSDKVAGGLGRPLFNVVVDLDTFEGRAPPDLLGHRAEIVGVGAIPAATIERFLCDAGVSRIVTRGRSLPLDVGAVSRTATPAQWRALITHAGGCEFPGCTAPWEWCQAHHLTHWTAEHRTAIAGLALGCNGHHRLLHKPGWSMARRPDLTIVVTRPDGTQLTGP